MKCKKCGEKFKKTQYCPYCGASKDYTAEKNEQSEYNVKKKKRSVFGIIISFIFTVIVSLVLIISMSVNSVLKNSLDKVFLNTDWNKFETDNQTIIEYITSSVNNYEFNEETCMTVFSSESGQTYIKGMADNIKEIIFEKAEFKPLASDDIVQVVRNSGVPLNEPVYNSIKSGMEKPVSIYNEHIGDVFSGISIVLIRFFFGTAGFITEGVILFIMLVISAKSYRRTGNGIKACGIIYIISSLISSALFISSAVILKINLSAILIQSKAIWILIISLISGIILTFTSKIFIKTGNKIAERKLNKQIKNSDATEKNEEYENKNVNLNPYSPTGELKNNEKICSACGNINNSEAKFCRKCGSEI